MENTWFYYSDFRNSDLSGCCLENSEIRGCNLTNANFNNTNLINVIFEDKWDSKKNIFKNTQLNNIKIDDKNAEYLRKLGVEFTRAEEMKGRYILNIGRL